MATDTTVKSIFCECWEWPLFIGSSIRFKEDGTGNVIWSHHTIVILDQIPLTSPKLVCGLESSLFIAAEIDWKPLEDCSTILERKVDMNTDFQVSLDVEITLTKRALGDIPPGWVNETNLVDAAFRPRTYKIDLSKGRFYKPDWLAFEGDLSKPAKDLEIWYGLRLVFNQSPYPPLEEWKEDVDYGIPWRAAKGIKFFEFRDFYQNTEESIYRPPDVDEKTIAERRQKALEKLRRLRAIREEEEEKPRSA